MQTSQAQPTGQAREMTITRILHAPREQVWKAFTDAEWMKQWWSPSGFTTSVARMDPQVGGGYLICMFTPEGDAVWNRGTILEMDPPNRLVMTDSFADEDGDVVSATYYGMSADFPLKMTYRCTFEEDGSNTRLTVKYDDLSTLSESDYNEMKQGWIEELDKLDAFLARQGGVSGPGSDTKPGFSSDTKSGQAALGLLDQDVESC